MVATVLPTKTKSSESPDGDDQQLVDSKAEPETDGGVCRKGRFWCALIRTLCSLGLLLFFTFLLVMQIIGLQFFVENYDTEVETSFEHPVNVTFPAITICNYNGVQKSRFCEHYPDRCQKLKNGTYKFASNFTASDFFGVMTKMREYESIRYRQKWEELAVKCLRVNPDEQDGMECRHVNDLIHVNARYQNCFTFMTGQDTLSGAYKRTGVYMNINFQADEYVEDNPVGGFIYFHDRNKRIPDNFPRYIHHLKPGMFVNFWLKQTSYDRLPSPYEPGCREYDEDNSPVSSEQECINQCMYDAYLTACECLPISLPTFDASDLPIFCDNGNVSRECYKKLDPRHAEASCQDSCPISCSEDVYDVKVVSQKVPNYSSEMEKANREMSQIRVQFETNEIKVYRDLPQFVHYFNIYIMTACLYSLAVLFLLLLTLKSMRDICGACKSAPRSQVSPGCAS